MPPLELDRMLLLGGYGVVSMAGVLVLALLCQCVLHRRPDDASQPLRTSVGKDTLIGEDGDDEEEDDDNDAREQQFDDVTKALGAVELLQAAMSQEPQLNREQGAVTTEARRDPEEGKLVFLD